MRICVIQNCPRKHLARGLCGLHYQRWCAHGTANKGEHSRKGRLLKPLEERFWAKVEKTSGCWLWTGSTAQRGYGAIAEGGTGRRSKILRAHRVSWEIHYGPITRSNQINHFCHNRKCVRPTHLYVGTQRDNLLDAQEAGHLLRDLQNGQMKSGLT